MSDQSPWNTPAWPKWVAKPGSPGWPDGAVRWLGDNIPSNQWRHTALKDEPWMLCIAAATTIRADLDALREQYRVTATQWAKLIPEDSARRLLKATAAEGARLKALLEQVLALEAALAHPGTGAGRAKPPPKTDLRPSLSERTLES